MTVFANFWVSIDDAFENEFVRNQFRLSYLTDGEDDCFSGEGCDDTPPVTLPVLEGLDIPVPTANSVAGCRADTQVQALSFSFHFTSNTS